MNAPEKGRRLLPPAPAKKETHYEALKRLGLIGCIKGPPDLAENHKKYIRKAMRAKHAR